MAPKKDYTPLQMCNAIEAVKNGEKVAIAAKRFGVPRITLYNKVSGKSPVVCSMGPSTFLTYDEEKILEHWIIDMNNKHIPVTKEELLDSVQRIITDKGRTTPFTENRPGKKWYGLFLKRHPIIAERTAQNLTTARDNVKEEDINRWFEEVEAYLQEKGLMEVTKEPERIFNTDESAFFLSPKAGKVLAKRGEKHIYQTSGDEKDNLTVLITGNAAGLLAPPMVVFNYERVPSSISSNFPEDWAIGRSASGWMCGSTFYEYIANIFHPWLLQQNIKKPVLFFLDGHRSHLTLHLSDFCCANGIEIVALNPNSTHILQPMDLAIFRPLKAYWKKAVNKWKLEHLGQNLKKEHFAPVLKTALESISEDCIKNGFRGGGLYPFGLSYVDLSKIKSRQKSTVDQTAQKHFLRCLETEIVSKFRSEKLQLFNELFYKGREELDSRLPEEDTSLYVLWASNKQAFGDSCQDNEASKSSQTLDPKVNEAPSTSTKSDNDSPASILNINTDPSTQDFSSNKNKIAQQEKTSQNKELETKQMGCPIATVSPISKNATTAQKEIVPRNEASETKKTDHPTVSILPVQEDLWHGSLSNDHDHMEDSTPSVTLVTVNNPYQIKITENESSTLRDTFKDLLTDVIPSSSKQLQYTEATQSTSGTLYQHDDVIESLSVAQNTPAKETQNPDIFKIKPKTNLFIPSPFKRNLFWPGDDDNLKGKKRKPREKIPSVITSQKWREYHQQKEREKEQKEKEKERKAKERAEKKLLKENRTKHKEQNKKKKTKLNKPMPVSSSDDTETEIPYAESGDSDYSTYAEEILKKTIPERAEGSSYSESEDEPLRKISKRGQKYTKGNYVIIKYEGEYFPGKIENVHGNCFEIKTMTFSVGNTFRWPEKPDQIWYHEQDIVQKIREPVLTNKRGFYSVTEMTKYLPFIM